jgi:hypothetical protein
MPLATQYPCILSFVSQVNATGNTVPLSPDSLEGAWQKQWREHSVLALKTYVDQDSCSCITRWLVSSRWAWLTVSPPHLPALIVLYCNSTSVYISYSKYYTQIYSASYSMDTRVSFTKVQRPGCEIDHSSQSNTEVKSKWHCTSASPVYLEECTGTTLPLTKCKLTAHNMIWQFTLTALLTINTRLCNCCRCGSRQTLGWFNLCHLQCFRLQKLGYFNLSEQTIRQPVYEVALLL